MPLILGSQSFHRGQILRLFDLPFSQVSSDFDEEQIVFNKDPQKYVLKLSSCKAAVLAKKFPHSPILTADTTVYQNGKIFGKPKDKEEAFQTLKELAGKWHSVFTGVTLYTNGQQFQECEETRLLFHELSDEQIHAYHQTITYLDKAGGYTMQGAGALIIKRIEGSYYNVVGLPFHSLELLLRKVNINLWMHLKGPSS
jgi:septum formation protein